MPVAAPPPDIAALIRRLAAEAQMDPNLALALAQQESNLDPSARSTKGAMGLFQLMPDTWAEQAGRLGMDPNTDPMDPEANARAGIDYYKRMNQQFSDPIMALLAYHSGPGNIKGGSAQSALDGVGPEGSAYPAGVLSNYNKLSGRLAPEGPADLNPGTLGTGTGMPMQIDPLTKALMTLTQMQQGGVQQAGMTSGGMAIPKAGLANVDTPNAPGMPTGLHGRTQAFARRLAGMRFPQYAPPGETRYPQSILSGLPSAVSGFLNTMSSRGDAMIASEDRVREGEMKTAQMKELGARTAGLEAGLKQDTEEYEKTKKQAAGKIGGLRAMLGDAAKGVSDDDLIGTLNASVAMADYKARQSTAAQADLELRMANRNFSQAGFHDATSLQDKHTALLQTVAEIEQKRSAIAPYLDMRKVVDEEEKPDVRAGLNAEMDRIIAEMNGGKKPEYLPSEESLIAERDADLTILQSLEESAGRFDQKVAASMTAAREKLLNPSGAGKKPAGKDWGAIIKQNILGPAGTQNDQDAAAAKAYEASSLSPLNTSFNPLSQERQAQTAAGEKIFHLSPAQPSLVNAIGMLGEAAVEKLTKVFYNAAGSVSGTLAQTGYDIVKGRISSGANKTNPEIQRMRTETIAALQKSGKKFDKEYVDSVIAHRILYMMYPDLLKYAGQFPNSEMTDLSGVGPSESKNAIRKRVTGPQNPHIGPE